MSQQQHGYGYGYGNSGAETPPPERGSRRRKLAAVAGSVYRAGVAAASGLREQYNNTRMRGAEWSDTQVSIPEAFPQVSIVTHGDEQMVLFPTYAKRHVKGCGPAGRFPPGHSFPATSAAQMGVSEEEYWRQEWTRTEDETAVVDVDVRGWIYMPSRGPTTRRNRMLIGLARRLSGIPPPSTQAEPSASGREDYEQMREEQRIAREAREIERRGQGEKEVATRGGYSESPGGSRNSEQAPASPPPSPTLPARTTSGMQSELTESELAVANANLMARLGPFMTTPLVQIPITIFFYNDVQSRSHTVLTDDSGHFSTRVALDFVPTDVRVLANENISATKKVQVIESRGVSLISDIDDTVKRSNIWMGAREIFRNTFVRDLADLTIDGVREWYHAMHEMGVRVHYCSNSPWQLFPVLATFFHTAGLPQGSIHLKQYSGMLQGIFEPVAERKKGTLEAILRDFPERKFLLVGDSGEADLEVYTELALANPGRILAVFIRDVTTPEQPGFFDSSFSLASEQRGTQAGAPTGSGNGSAGDRPRRKPQPPPRAATAPPSSGRPATETRNDFADGPAQTNPGSDQNAARPPTSADANSSRRAPPPRPAKPVALRSAPPDAGSGNQRVPPAGADPAPAPAQRTPASGGTTLSSSSNGPRPTPPPPPPPRRRGAQAAASRQQQQQQQQQRNAANSSPDVPDLESLSAPGLASASTFSAASQASVAADTMANKKVDLWLRRLARAHETLDAHGVKLYTWRRGEDVIAEARGIVREALREAVR